MLNLSITSKSFSVSVVEANYYSETNSTGATQRFF